MVDSFSDGVSQTCCRNKVLDKRLHASALVRSGGPGHGPHPDARSSPSCWKRSHEKLVMSLMK